MALAAYNFHIQDTLGNDVTGAEITVRRESDSGLPQLYDDRGGLAGDALGNPFTSAAASGRFHVAGSAYRIEARKSGNLVAEPLRYVAVGTAGERDAEDVTAEIDAAVATLEAELTQNPHLRHGEIQYLNDGNARDLTLGASGYGNGISLWNAALARWQLFLIPPQVSITALSNNGSGLIRVTHAATPARNFVTGQWLTIRGCTGITAPNIVFGPGVQGAWKITRIDATNFDLQGSTWPGGTYTGNGVIDPVVAASIDSITINGVANQVMPVSVPPAAPVPYLAGLRFLDAACTVGEIVLDSVLEGPGADFVNVNKDSETGLNLLPSYTKVPLIGISARHNVAGIGNGTALIPSPSYYNRAPRFAEARYAGNTGGVTGTYVAIPVASGQDYDKLRVLSFRGRRYKLDGQLLLNSTAAALITAKVTVTHSVATESFEFPINHDGVGVKPLPIDAWLTGHAVTGFWEVTLEIKTTAGTATVVSTGLTNSRIIMNAFY